MTRPPKLLLSLLFAGVAMTTLASSHAQDAPRADDDEAVIAPASVRRAWWTAFHEPALDLLLSDASLLRGLDRAQVLALQVHATSAYLRARVYSVRLQTAGAIGAAARREIVLLQQRGETGPELARARAFARASVQRGQEFVVLRSDSITELADALRGRYPARQLAVSLAAALSQPRLPLPEFETPEALSGLVLRQRPDLMRAERTLVFSSRASMAGRDDDLRWAEAWSDPQALAELQNLLVAKDWLAASIGAAALEWVSFQESIVGAGQARLSGLLRAALEAGTAPGEHPPKPSQERRQRALALAHGAPRAVSRCRRACIA